MIFDCNLLCTLREVRDESFDAPLTLTGDGLWAGVLSSGHCRTEAPGAQVTSGSPGDILLSAGSVQLLPQSPCHLLAVQLAGSAPQLFAAGLPAARFVPGAACGNAAELLALLCQNGPDATPHQSQTIYTLLCALAHADEPPWKLSPLVAAAVEAIRSNYIGLYGVEELSRQLRVSKCHLVRCFSAEMGVSPGKYLTGVRIEAAKLLLQEREYSLDMIAGLCGFSSANYLCRVFKRETGQTPAAWRDSNAPAPTRHLPPQSNEIYL